jgi:hypothetical protein
MEKKSHVKKGTTVPDKIALMTDPKFKAAVKGAFGDIDAYSQMLQGGDDDLSADDARKKITQMMYNNMKWMDDPVQAAKYQLAKALTYQQTMEMIDPERALLDIDMQLKLTDSMRKSIKLINDMKPKEINVNMKKMDDKEGFPNPDYIEAEVDEE